MFGGSPTTTTPLGSPSSFALASPSKGVFGVTVNANVVRPPRRTLAGSLVSSTNDSTTSISMNSEATRTRPRPDICPSSETVVAIT